jgi:hypothetical protein
VLLRVPPIVLGDGFDIDVERQEHGGGAKQGHDDPASRGCRVQG